MTPFDTLLTRLEQLEKAARDDRLFDIPINQIIERRLPIEEFINQTRGSLPKLLEIIRVQRSALKYYASGRGIDMGDKDYEMVVQADGQDQHELFGMRARAAIAQADKIAGDEK